MQQRDDQYFIILGQSANDEPVRPHNWAERFAGNLAIFGRDRRLRYADTLTPVMIDGIKSLRVARSLEDTHPTLMHDICKFAELHDLVVATEPAASLPLAC